MTAYDASGSIRKGGGGRSRSKGKRGELEAAKALSVATGIEWRRTAQRWGKAKADLEAVDGGVPVHVECKRFATGITYWHDRAELGKLHCYIGEREHRGYMWCLLSDVMQYAKQDISAELGIRSATMEHWMRQASNDADDGWVPIVIARQDDRDWIICWRYEHDDAFMSILRGLVK